jgi:hypothetical protein
MHPGMMDQQQAAMMGHPGMHPNMYNMGPGGQQGMRMMGPHPGMQQQQPPQQQQHPMSGGVRTPMGPQGQVPGGGGVGNPQMMPQQSYHNMPGQQQQHMMSNQYPSNQQKPTSMPPGVMGGQPPQQKLPLQQQQQQQQHMSVQQQQQGYEQVKLAEQKMARGITDSPSYPAGSGLSPPNFNDDLQQKNISSELGVGRVELGLGGGELGVGIGPQEAASSIEGVTAANNNQPSPAVPISEASSQPGNNFNYGEVGLG